MREALKKSPDIQVTIEDMIAVGDKAASRYTVSSTNASTGKLERLLIIDFYRFANGMIAEALGIDVQSEAQA